MLVLILINFDYKKSTPLKGLVVFCCIFANNKLNNLGDSHHASDFLAGTDEYGDTHANGTFITHQGRI